MANPEHIEILNLGVAEWNGWRRRNPATTPDLHDARLNFADLVGADLQSADLSHASLSMANLSFTDIHDADLSQANLRRANLMGADLSGANLFAAKLFEANLYRANLIGAKFRNADLHGADLSAAEMVDTDFTLASFGATRFGGNNLTKVIGLESTIHRGPSTIGVDTLFLSDGNIPIGFLRETGIPEDFITFLPSLVAARVFEFHSCFISYSHQDEEFSRRLHSRMRNENLRVWYAPEDMKGGRKLHEEIFSAIQMHDKLLLVLSEDSIKSEWVITEVRRARKVEQQENRRKLFPIRLVNIKSIEKWGCFDADTGKDLAVELREYYIPDFSNWQDRDAFEREFSKLLRDLKATES
jgi:uncharacterized protein YjbI with pentapeptide repeats